MTFIWSGVNITKQTDLGKMQWWGGLEVANTFSADNREDIKWLETRDEIKNKITFYNFLNKNFSKEMINDQIEEQLLKKYVHLKKENETYALILDKIDPNQESDIEWNVIDAWNQTIEILVSQKTTDTPSLRSKFSIKAVETFQINEE